MGNNDYSEGLEGKAEHSEMFRKSGALMSGHFSLTSGRHSAWYLQCALVLQYPEYAEALCRDLAQAFADSGIEAVIGPALGGVIVSYETGRALGVKSMFAERKEGKMCLRRGFSIRPGERILVVEDVVTTGGSIMEVADLVREAGGQCAGFGMIVDRTGGRIAWDGPAHSLLKAAFETYEPEKCPLCRKGYEIEKPGSRR